MRRLDSSGTQPGPGNTGVGGIHGLLARTDNRLLTIGDSGAHAYYHADGSGNVTALINTNQTRIAWYLYDAFGNILGQGGPLAEANLYRFSSKEFHLNSGLSYYLYRYYDPASQRWVNQDPMGEYGGLNLYRFTYNNPVNFVDPNGLWGIQFGNFNIGWGNPNLAFDSDSWNDLAQGAAATADGIIPFADPFQKYYDPCDPILRASRTLGEVGRDVGLMAIPGGGMANLAKWARNPLLYEIGSTTVPADVYAAMEGLSAVEKGKYLLFWYGPGGTLSLSAEALGEGAFATTIPTGLTPGLSLFGVGALQAADSASHKPCGCP